MSVYCMMRVLRLVAHASPQGLAAQAALAGAGLVSGRPASSAHPFLHHLVHPAFTYPAPISPPTNTRISTSISARSGLASYIDRVRASLGSGACAPELSKRLDHRPPGSPSLRAGQATAVLPCDPSLSRVLKSSADAASRSRRGLLNRPCSAVPATGRHIHPSTHPSIPPTTSTFPLYLLPCSSCPNSGQTAHISHTSCTVDSLSYQTKAAPEKGRCHRVAQSSLLRRFLRRFTVVAVSSALL